MRTKNLTPLLQFTNFLGIDPFKAAGIQLEQVATKPKNQHCDCSLAFSYQSTSAYTREDYEQMLTLAENIFLQEAGFYAAPFQILDEEQEYGYFGSNVKQMPAVEPNYSCRLLDTGTYELEFVGYVELVREDGDGITQQFTATTVVPSGTTRDQIKLYFTEADANYLGTLDYNESKKYEIRPLTNSKLVGTTFYINEGAYLFKKPELDDETVCVPHELDTYVEEVALYILKVDKCDQGLFIYNGVPCSTPGCSETTTNLCLQKKMVGKDLWLTPLPVNCTVDDDGEFVYTSYCLTNKPSRVSLNYINGSKLTTNGEMDYVNFSIIAKLAIALADCVREWCACDICAKSKWEHYHSVPKEKIENAQPTTLGTGDRYQILLTPFTMQLIEGLPPYYGIIQGLQEINYIRCLNRGRN